MKRYYFTLILSGISEITPRLANALFEATRGDIEFQMRGGIASLDFNRQAPSMKAAISSAIKEVEEANLGIKVVRVESESANTIARINADLLLIPKE